MTPYDKLIAGYGQEGCKFLNALGIERIPAAQMTLHPFEGNNSDAKIKVDFVPH